MSLVVFPKRIEGGVQNMATDWWIFENLSGPTFRHYEWKNKEYSFGYGQDWRWVENKTGQSINQLLRRPTGGGIVRHCSDWTYCFSIPRKHSSFRIAPLDFYKQIHLAIMNALDNQGILVRLQPCPVNKLKSIPGDCFMEPVGWDLIDDESGEKIAGAAMKRSRRGMLLQGTIAFNKKWKIQKEELRSKIIQNLLVFLQEDKTEYEEWPNSFMAERKEIADWYSSLDWKKYRRRI